VQFPGENVRLQGTAAGSFAGRDIDRSLNISSLRTRTLDDRRRGVLCNRSLRNRHSADPNSRSRQLAAEPAVLQRRQDVQNDEEHRKNHHGDGTVRGRGHGLHPRLVFRPQDRHAIPNPVQQETLPVQGHRRRSGVLVRKDRFRRARGTDGTSAEEDQRRQRGSREDPLPRRLRRISTEGRCRKGRVFAARTRPHARRRGNFSKVWLRLKEERIRPRIARSTAKEARSEECVQDSKIRSGSKEKYSTVRSPWRFNSHFARPCVRIRRTGVYSRPAFSGKKSAAARRRLVSGGCYGKKGGRPGRRHRVTAAAVAAATAILIPANPLSRRRVLGRYCRVCARPAT